jgi:uncharacterized protein YbdZ (MbtH family)
VVCCFHEGKSQAWKALNPNALHQMRACSEVCKGGFHALPKWEAREAPELMSRPTIPVCDQCGKQKGPSNRWFVAYIDSQYFSLWPNQKANPAEGVVQIDLCGEACAQKALAQWMEKQKA